jgi:hypothetical protein
MISFMSEQVSSSSHWRKAAIGLLIASMFSTESCIITENGNQPTIAVSGNELPPVEPNINPQTGLINHSMMDLAKSQNGNQIISRCFTEPLKPQYNFGWPGPVPIRHNFKNKTDYDKALNDFFNKPSEFTYNSPRISLPFMDGKLLDMPTNSASGKVLDSIVKVSTKDYWGSGFTTLDAHGQEVIVTAAHVAANVPLKNLTITSMSGKNIHPVGGCYINEDIGLTVTPPNQKIVENFAPIKSEGQGTSSIDLAILVMPHNLGNTALGFITKDSQRGDWVEFTNFEVGSSLKNPANFYGLITSNYDEPLNALTGLSNQPNAIAAEVNRSAPGESGGLVSANDKIVGLSFAGTDKLGYYDSQIDLASRNIFLANANYGFDGGITPASATIVGADTIELALRSSKA